MALVSLRLFSFLIFLLNITLISHHPTNAQLNDLKSACGAITDNSNSTYQTNLKALLSNISNTQIDHGFHSFSYGNNPDKVNTIVLCRGDVTPQDCRNCVSDLGAVLPQMCPNKKEVFGWYNKCVLRYSNRNIIGAVETSPYIYVYMVLEALEKEKFQSTVRCMMKFLRERAASGNSIRKFAAANVTGPSNQTIYGLAQCVPDLSPNGCRICLDVAISRIPECCDGLSGGIVATPSCSIHYESDSFFDPAAAQPFTSLPSPPYPPPPFAQPITKQGKSNTAGIVIAIVIPTVAFITFTVVIFFVIIKARRRLKRNIENETWRAEEDKDEIIIADSLQMDFDTIKLATNNFSEANKLGQGGFGSVYLGRLFNGQDIAVKRLNRNSGQGDMEFKNEVLLMAKLQHRNLVKLLGFCFKNKERLLIYEFIPNKSLDYFIFDPIKSASLNWKKRIKIIEGICRGLLYLHQDSEERIIHRDLKPSNILLDEEMDAKISDFGMARLFAMDQTQGNTTRVVGTYGYIAPEYIKRGIFSTKSDVYSFGVLLLEIISGQKNGTSCSKENAESIGAATWKNWKKGTLANIVDPTLMEDKGSRNKIMRCIQIGLLCVQENARDRPSMDSIVTMLSTHSITLPIPSEPSFYIWTSIPSSIKSSSADQSMEGPRYEVSLTEQYPR